MSNRGTFVWYDLMTKNADAAKKFYGGLFGWTINSVDMGPGGTYDMLVNGTARLGGLMPMQTAEHPSHWQGYIDVANIDATATQVKSLGGQVLVGPMDIPGIGRFAVIQDPQGANVSLFQGNEPPTGPSARHSEKGDIGWAELQTSDLEGAKAFYGAIAGWNTGEAMDMGPMGPYVFAKAASGTVGGLMTRPPEMRHSAWTYYVNVENTDATLKRAKDLGGLVFVPPTDVPGMVRFAVVQDPTGAAIGFAQSLR